MFIIDLMRGGYVVRPIHFLGGVNSKVMKSSMALLQLAFITSNYTSAACALQLVAAKWRIVCLAFPWPCVMKVERLLSGQQVVRDPSLSLAQATFPH